MSDVIFGTTWSGPITVQRIYERRGRTMRHLEDPDRDVPMRLAEVHYARVMVDLGGDVAKRHQRLVDDVAGVEERVPGLWEQASALTAIAEVEEERARQAELRATLRGTAELKRRAKAVGDEAATARAQAREVQAAAETATAHLRIAREDLEAFEDEHLELWLAARYDEVKARTEAFHRALRAAEEAHRALDEAFQPLDHIDVPRPIPAVVRNWDVEFGGHDTSKMRRLTADLRSWGYKL